MLHGWLVGVKGWIVVSGSEKAGWWLVRMESWMVVGGSEKVGWRLVEVRRLDGGWWK